MLGGASSVEDFQLLQIKLVFSPTDNISGIIWRSVKYYYCLLYIFLGRLSKYHNTQVPFTASWKGFLYVICYSLPPQPVYLLLIVIIYNIALYLRHLCTFTSRISPLQLSSAHHRCVFSSIYHKQVKLTPFSLLASCITPLEDTA